MTNLTLSNFQQYKTVEAQAVIKRVILKQKIWKSCTRFWTNTTCFRPCRSAKGWKLTTLIFYPMSLRRKLLSVIIWFEFTF
ncbi:MAG TPA: hypothetical protein VNI60_12705 [Pyrinomonadaceae bacterium]|nr:hypothetical protein [Pyrinomonadaceae bacterium]